MAECTTCKHSAPLHTDGGRCSVPGCACDELVLEEIAPDVDPPKPGCCLHIAGEGAVWLVEDIAEVQATLDSRPEFAEFIGCDLYEQGYETFPVHVRPQAVSSFHGFLQRKWDDILKA